MPRKRNHSADHVTVRVCLKFTSLHANCYRPRASPMPATVTIVFSAAKFSESRPSTTRSPIIQAEAVIPAPIKSQLCAGSFLRSSPHILVDDMSRQSTPPNSQNVSTGSVLSKTTPLKRDIHGTQAFFLALTGGFGTIFGNDSRRMREIRRPNAC